MQPGDPIDEEGVWTKTWTKEEAGTPKERCSAPGCEVRCGRTKRVYDGKLGNFRPFSRIKGESRGDAVEAVDAVKSRIESLEA